MSYLIPFSKLPPRLNLSFLEIVGTRQWDLIEQILTLFPLQVVERRFPCLASGHRVAHSEPGSPVFWMNSLSLLEGQFSPCLTENFLPDLRCPEYHTIKGSVQREVLSLCTPLPFYLMMILLTYCF